METKNTQPSVPPQAKPTAAPAQTGLTDDRKRQIIEHYTQTLDARKPALLEHFKKWAEPAEAAFIEKFAAGGN